MYILALSSILTATLILCVNSIEFLPAVPLPLPATAQQAFCDTQNALCSAFHSGYTPHPAPLVRENGLVRSLTEEERPWPLTLTQVGSINMRFYCDLDPTGNLRVYSMPATWQYLRLGFQELWFRNREVCLRSCYCETDYARMDHACVTGGYQYLGRRVYLDCLNRRRMGRIMRQIREYQHRRYSLLRDDMNMPRLASVASTRNRRQGREYIERGGD